MMNITGFCEVNYFLYNERVPLQPLSGIHFHELLPIALKKDREFATHFRSVVKRPGVVPVVPGMEIFLSQIK